MEPRSSTHASFATALLAIGVLCELCGGLLVLCSESLGAALAHTLTVACAIIASSTIVRGSWPLLDQRAQTIAWASTGVLVACVPLLGMLALATVIAPIWRSARANDSDTWIELPMARRAQLGVRSYAGATRGSAARPSADARARAQAIGSLAVVPIREILRGTGPAHERIQAVMALRRMPARDALPLLRSALTDASEDVRLLAYAILERREKSLRASIERKLGALADQQDDGCSHHDGGSGQQLNALRELAHDHWELVHGGFVEGELAQRTLELAAEHTSAALALLMSSDASATAGREGDLAVLLARIELRRHRTQDAASALELAGRAGVAESALAPLLAELAFIERRFDRIPSLLALVTGAQLERPRLHAVIEHWRAPERRPVS